MQIPDWIKLKLLFPHRYTHVVKLTRNHFTMSGYNFLCCVFKCVHVCDELIYWILLFRMLEDATKLLVYIYKINAVHDTKYVLLQLYICLPVFVSMSVCLFVCVPVCVWGWECVYVNVRAYMCVHACVYMCICLFLYVNVCMCMRVHVCVCVCVMHACCASVYQTSIFDVLHL